MVVLPEPVGPVTRMIPCGRSISRLIFSTSPGRSPICSRSSDTTPSVEHAHHARLAEHRRQRRDAQIDGAPADRKVDAAVLRQTRLGNVQAAHDLHAADERGREVQRRRLQLVEHAVHAIANLELVLERLQVDVGRAVADGLVEDVVEQLAHGRRVRHLLGVLEVGHAGGPDALSRLLAARDAVLLDLLQDRGHHLLLAAVRLVDGRGNLARVGNDAVDVAVRREADIVERGFVHGIRHRNREHLAVERDGDELERPRDGLVDLLDRVLLRLELR